MKRYAAILLCLYLLAVLCGCGPDQTPPETSTPAQDTAPAQPEVSGNTSLCAISLPRVFEYTIDQYMRIMTYSYPSPSFLHKNTEAVSAVTLDLQSRADATASEAADILELANDTYAATGIAPDYSYEMTCDVKRLDRNLFSILTTYRSYTGGAHGGYITESVTYDLTTGTLLTLSDILSVDIFEVTRLLLNQLSGEEDLYPTYESDALEILRRDAEPSNWYLSDTGLGFFFNPYEIAPFSTGTVYAEIPYASLSGILKDRFCPAEKAEANGAINAILYDHADLTGIEQFAELVTDPEGTEILLYPSGTVTDLRIDQGYWDMDGVYFFADSTVFACPQLSEGDAVKVTTMVPEIMPDLRIQYTSNGETVTQYLLLSGKDGSALLIE